MIEPSDRQRWIARWIPAFSGYIRSHDRRISEEAFRNYVTERLLWFEKRLSEVRHEPLMFDGAQRFQVAAGLVCGRLHDLADHLQSVPYAYGEFLTAPALPPAEAERFYDRDQAVLRRLGALQSVVDPTLTASTDTVSLATALGELADALTQAIQARQAAINDYTPSYGMPRP